MITQPHVVTIFLLLRYWSCIMSYEIAKKLMAEHTGLKKAVEAFLTIQSFAPGANLVAVKTAILAAVRRRDSLVKELGYPGDLLDYEIKKWDSSNKELLDSFAAKPPVAAQPTPPKPATPQSPVAAQPTPPKPATPQSPVAAQPTPPKPATPQSPPPTPVVEEVEVIELTDLDEELIQLIQEAIPEEAELVEAEEEPVMVQPPKKKGKAA